MIDNKMLELCEINWEALASFTTGCLAVLAAWHIGKRQMRIQSQSLNADLFERRFQNYETVRDCLMQFHQNPLDHDAIFIHKFHRAKREAEFLFSSDVSNKLCCIWKTCLDLTEISSQIKYDISIGNSISPNHSRDKSEISKKLGNEIKNLPEIYEQMHLNAIPR